MSNRQMRRLRKQLAQEELSVKKHENEEERLDSPEEYAEPRSSAFLAFGDDDSSNEESNSPEEDKGESAVIVESSFKPKRTTETKAEAKDESSLIQEAILESQKEREKFNKHNEMDESLTGIFDVDETYLNSDNGIKRQLGACIEEENSKPKPKTLLRSRRTISTTFCTPDKDWAPPPTFVSGGGGARQISLDDETSMISTFTFEASESYLQSQKELELVKSTHDPNAVVEGLRKYPFNVDALLLLSQVYLQTSQLETSELMLRRALFALQSFLHPRFVKKAKCGNARLVELEEIQDAALNSSFRRAIFRSVILCDRRGCKISSFNLAKFLLSLNPCSDPCHVLVLIDVLALKVDPGYVVRLSESALELFKISQPMEYQLPNFAYSIILAFCKLDKVANAKKAAKHALVTFPGQFVMIYGVLIEEGLYRENEFSEKAKAKMLSLTRDKDIFDSLYHLYAHRSKSLWTETNENLFNKTGIQWLIDLANAFEFEEAMTITFTEQDKQFQNRYHDIRLTDFSDDTGVLSLVEEPELRNQQDMEERPIPRLSQRVANLRLNDIALFFQTLHPNVSLPYEEERDRED